MKIYFVCVTSASFHGTYLQLLLTHSEELILFLLFPFSHLGNGLVGRALDELVAPFRAYGLREEEIVCVSAMIALNPCKLIYIYKKIYSGT